MSTGKSEGHTREAFSVFAIGDIDELGICGVVLRGDREAVKSIADLFGESVYVSPVNAHDDMLEALKAIDDDWTSTFPGGPDGPRDWAGGLGTLSDDTVARWKAIRAAIARASGHS